jgi:hypothetical protein
MANLFDVEQEELISLASGQVLETTAADRLLGTEQLGEEQFSKFIKNKIFSEEPDIFAKLERKPALN